MWANARMSALAGIRLLGDDEYQRLQDIAARYRAEGTPAGLAFDVGYLMAIIFRFKDRLERGERIICTRPHMTP